MMTVIPAVVPAVVAVTMVVAVMMAPMMAILNLLNVGGLRSAYGRQRQR
jgi:hypothetical protein